MLPIHVKAPPTGDAWLHEPKWDGYRFQVIKNGHQVWLCSKSGVDWTERLPGIVEAFAELPTQAAIIDGELCLCDSRGRPDFRAFHAEMRQGRPDTSRMAFFAFDLIHRDGVDLRRMTLTERKRDLERLCHKSRRDVSCLYLVESFPEGAPLLEWCGHFGLEGIVSKRKGSGYGSGVSRQWVKVKWADWKADNEFRHKLFEGPKKPELSERSLKKKREALARVREQMRLPGVSQAMLREFRKHETVLEREIAAIEAKGV
jgi:bifunctional non-homologous end joining protein LigD